MSLVGHFVLNRNFYDGIDDHLPSYLLQSTSRPVTFGIIDHSGQSWLYPIDNTLSLTRPFF
jgi:hypothetical protein